MKRKMSGGASTTNSNDNYIYNDVQYGDYKEGNKLFGSKAGSELYDEEQAKPATVFRVKKTGTADKGEKWRLLVDGEVSLILDSDKLTNKECAFLRSPAGMIFLLAEMRAGIKSTDDLRKKMKVKLKESLT